MRQEIVKDRPHEGAAPSQLTAFLKLCFSPLHLVSLHFSIPQWMPDSLERIDGTQTNPATIPNFMSRGKKYSPQTKPRVNHFPPLWHIKYSSDSPIVEFWFTHSKLGWLPPSSTSVCSAGEGLLFLQIIKTTAARAALKGKKLQFGVFWF